MDARRLKTSNSGVFVSSSFETSLFIEGLTYRDSTMQMVRVLSSKSEIKDCNISNVTVNSNNLIGYGSSEENKLVNVTINNVVSDHTEIISVSNSGVELISMLSIQNTNTAGITFDQAKIEKITETVITNNSQGLILYDSEIELLTNSYFES